MASTYTTNTGIELITTGEQSGTWGDTTNVNLQIIDRLTNGVGSIALSGTTHTLTTTDGTLSDGQYAVLVFGGSPSGTNTVTVNPNDQQKVFIVKNGSGQTVVLTQGSGGNVTLLNGDSKIVYCDGAGASAAVVDVTGDLALSDVNIDGGTIDGVTLGTNSPVTEAQIDNLNFNGNAITSTDTNGNIAITPNGTGEVDISKVDINGGTIDGTVIGGSTPAAISGTTGTFSGDLTVDTNTLFVDASTNRVGIGTSSPSATLTVGSGNGIRIEDTFPELNLYDTNVTGLYHAIQGAGDGALRFSADAGNVGTESRVEFFVDNSEAMRIDSSGSVGIGTSSPAVALHVIGRGRFTRGVELGIDGVDATSYITQYRSTVETFMGPLTTRMLFGTFSNHDVAFLTNNTEAMRIDSSGELLVGKTDTGIVTAGHILNGVGILSSTRDSAAVHLLNRTGTDGTIVEYRNDGSIVGTVSISAAATSYNTSSDYRLKEDVQPMVGATDRVLALNPVNFAWKVDGTRVDGFLAHEAQEVVPEAVTGTKDAVDADGNPEYQGIDQGKLVPLLTAALQDALKRIEALEGNPE